MNKLKVISVSLLVFVGLEIITRKQESFWWIVSFLMIVVFLVSLNITGSRFRQRKNLSLLVLPLLYLTGLFSFFIFLQEGFLRHLYILITCLFLGILLLNNSEAAQKTLVFEEEKKKRNLINNLITLFCSFLIYSGVWGISILLNWPTWTAILISVIITFALAYQSFWFAKILKRKAWLYILALSLIVGEVSWSLTFWPAGFLAFGSVLFSLYFVFQGVIQAYLKEELTERILWQHLILTGLFLLASLGTAKWTY